MAPTAKKQSAPCKPEPARSTGLHRPLTPLEEHAILRLLASAMGLPRMCVFKACRRRKRCFGPGMECVEHHRGIVRKRMGAAAALIAKLEV